MARWPSGPGQHTQICPPAASNTNVVIAGVEPHEKLHNLRRITAKGHPSLTWLSRDERPLSRRDVVNALLGTSAGGRGEERDQELRFQVVVYLSLTPLTTTCHLYLTLYLPPLATT